MEIIRDAQVIKTRMEQFQASQDLRQRKTMSVPEMRKLLGLKKTESYWLVHRNFFKTEMISGQMRVDLESFERWYANQVKHRKVNGEEPGIELKKTSYSFREVANLLGVHDADIYVAWKENDLETFTVDYVKRIPKDVFEKWYRSQNKFQKLERIPTTEELGSKYILVCDAAELLGISYDKLVRLSKYGKYKCILKMIVFENKKWFLKKDFQNFLNAQNEYQLISQIEPKRIDRKNELETKEYISREEAAVLAGVTKSTITKWIQADKFSCVGAGKVLRIKRDDFLQWIENNREGVN